MELEHPSIPIVNCWNYLLKGCYTLGKFLSRLEILVDKIALVHPDKSNSYYWTSGKDASNKFKGDVFEILCELLIRMSPLDERIGIADYHVAPIDEPGVDGFGKTFDGKPATVQIKYRLWDWTLDAICDHLDNFRAISYAKYGVDPQAVGHMLILTTGKEIHWKTLERQFQGKIRCISRNASYGCLVGIERRTIPGIVSLNSLLDDNITFWDTFRGSVNIYDYPCLSF